MNSEARTWVGGLIDAVGLLTATWALHRGYIVGPTWAVVAVPIVAYWLRARTGRVPPGGAALFVFLGLASATLGHHLGGRGT